MKKSLSAIDYRSCENISSQIEKIFDNLDVSTFTRSDYKYRIKLFIEFIGENRLNRNSFLEYKRYLQLRNDLSVSTKNKYLITARILLRELHKIGVIPSDITQNIKSLKQSRKHKRDGLNDQEMEMLSQGIQLLPNDKKSSRIKAILSLLAFQGLRQIEIVRLDVNDVDLVTKKAFITGKGQDDKEIISLQPKTVSALKEYLALNKIADGPLFVCESNIRKNQRLTTRGLRNIIKKVLCNLGINKTVHGFRHFFTTKLIETYKGDLLTVANYTRHKSLEMLQVYNDGLKESEDLPRFYRAFRGVNF